MKAKENGFMLTFIIFVILITFKIWIKFTFELQLIGLIILIGLSWTLKFFIFKKLNLKSKEK